jgi:hypothetical protein
MRLAALPAERDPLPDGRRPGFPGGPERARRLSTRPEPDARDAAPAVAAVPEYVAAAGE